MAERSGGTPVAFRPGAVAQRSEFDRNRSPSELVAKRVFGGPPRLLPDQFPISHLVRRTMIISGMLMLATVTSLWLGYRRRSRGSSSDHERTLVQVLHTLTVAPRCCLHLVQVEEQRFLVARDATGWKSVTPVQTFAAQLEAEEQNLGDSAAGQPLELPPDRSFLRSERWQEYKWIR
jgi:flagellar biogenesis protein FliO